MVGTEQKEQLQEDWKQSQKEWEKEVLTEHKENPYIGNSWLYHRRLQLRSAMHDGSKNDGFRDKNPMVTFIMETQSLIRGLQDDLEQLEDHKGIVIERTPNTHGLEFILSTMEYEDVAKRNHVVEKIEEYSKNHINDKSNVTRMAKLKELLK